MIDRIRLTVCLVAIILEYRTGDKLKIPEDPFVKELLPEFVEQWINDISNQFDGLIETENEDDLYRMAHTLKGSCFQFGLDELAEIGIELMTHSREHNWEKAKEVKDRLLQGFKDTKEFMDNSDEF